MKSIKILLADDHRIMREGVKNLIEREVDIEVIAEAENGREAVKLAIKLKPNIILMDISMPELNGLEAIKKIMRRQPDSRIIVLSMHSENEFIRKALKAGVYAYLLKGCAASELITAIRKANAGKKFLSEEISDVILHDFVDSSWKEGEFSDKQLTEREKEVLQLLSEGNSTKEIAEMLFISPKTVEAHRANIMDKLQLFTISELTKYAIRTGLTSLN